MKLWPGGVKTNDEAAVVLTPRSDAQRETTPSRQRRRIDLADRVPQKLTTEAAERTDVVVTMGCGDECPYIPDKRYIVWDLTDPKGLPIEQVREIRDEIAQRVEELVGEMDVG